MSYDGYDWIKVKRFVPIEGETAEARLARFEQHHVAETTFLIGEVRKLAAPRKVYFVLWLSPGSSDPRESRERHWVPVMAFDLLAKAQKTICRKVSKPEDTAWKEHNGHGLSWTCAEIRDYYILEMDVQ